MRSKISKWLAVVSIVALVGIGGYFALPQILADTAYPLEYVDEIKFCAGLFDLDEPLMAALILKESGYNQRAVSRAGAMGLTQVMPATFRGLLNRVPEFQGKGLSSDPFDPKTNICVGAAYLAGALANYGGNVTAALISYNGGDGAARRYLAARSSSVLVEETRTYAPKIEGAREVYVSMYGDKLTSRPIGGGGGGGVGGDSGGGGGTASAPALTPISVKVTKQSDKTQAFWKGFIKDVFSGFVK